MAQPTNGSLLHITGFYRTFVLGGGEQCVPAGARLRCANVPVPFMAVWRAPAGQTVWRPVLQRSRDRPDQTSEPPSRRALPDRPPPISYRRICRYSGGRRGRRSARPPPRPRLQADRGRAAPNGDALRPDGLREERAQHRYATHDLRAAWCYTQHLAHGTAVKYPHNTRYLKPRAVK